MILDRTDEGPIADELEDFLSSGTVAQELIPALCVIIVRASKQTDDRVRAIEEAISILEEKM